MTCAIGWWRCLLSCLICSCLGLLLILLQRLASNLLTGWDVDQDGKLEMQEIIYVLDEFCGEICFECRCPQVHQKKMTKLSGTLSVLETVAQTAIVIPITIFSVLIAIILVYYDAILPCYNCRDFRATAIHEIGHLLSLEHARGSENAIPLAMERTIPAPPPSAPPAPAEPPASTLAPPLPPEAPASNWSAPSPPACDTPWENVVIDPVALSFISPPPPPPLPPPPSAPPLAPGAFFSPPSLITFNASLPPFAPPPMPSPTQVSQMGTHAHGNLENAVMVAFGSTGLARPRAGEARRCLDQDDLDGIHFLYPWCGSSLLHPTCEYVLQDRLVGLRLLESWLKLMLLPVAIIGGAKLLAVCLLLTEDVVASYQVRREARRLLDEAEQAEKERKAHEAAERAAAGLEPDEPQQTSPTRHSPMARLGAGFGKMMPPRPKSMMRGMTISNLSPSRRDREASAPAQAPA